MKVYLQYSLELSPLWYYYWNLIPPISISNQFLQQTLGMLLIRVSHIRKQQIISFEANFWNSTRETEERGVKQNRDWGRSQAAQSGLQSLGGERMLPKGQGRDGGNRRKIRKK